MASGEELINLLLNLANTDDAKKTLISINTTLIALPNNLLCNIVGSLPFTAIFECLDSDNAEKIGLCCDVLNKLLAAMDPVVALQQFHTVILQGLHHPALEVTQLVLQQIKRATDICPQEILQMPDLLHDVIHLLGQESLSTAKMVASILLTLGQSTEALDIILNNHMLQQFNILLEQKDTFRFRVHELVVELARTNPTALMQCEQSGLLTRFVNELHKADDVLLQLNCLELLGRLVQVPHGLSYLEQAGVVDRLDDMLQTVDTDPMMGFLLPGLITFFGTMAKINPKETCVNHKHFLSTVFTMVDSPDPSQAVLALETLAFIATTSEGMLMLEKHDIPLHNACKRMGQFIREAVEEYRLRALDVVSSLLELKVSDQTAELLQLTECWFTQLSKSPFELILDMGKQPFTKVRCAALNVFCAIAIQPWGQTVMNSYPGFNEYLLDRSTEKDKECKDGKYNIVTLLVDSPTAAEIYGQVYFMKLRQYHRDGAYFIQAESAVAMESE